MNSTIKPKPCPECGSIWHSKMYHKPRKPIAIRTSLPRPTAPIKRGKRPKQQSDKEKEYQIWLKEVARPAVILRDGNRCNCCKMPDNQLDLDHIAGKGSHPELRQSIDNLQLLCRWPCHRNKTDGIDCTHGYR